MTRRGSDLTKVAAGVIAGVLAGGALVQAQSGGSNEVRACVTGDTTRPNTIIVGPNEPCPPNTSFRNWNVQGPPGPVTQDALDDLTLPSSKEPDTGPRRVRRIRRRAGRKDPRVIRVRRSVGPNTAPFKTAVLGCPSTHPIVTDGGPLLDPAPGPDAVYGVISNHSIANMGWVTAVQRYFGGRSPWRLTTEATCRKK
ncbi:MAG TPA: hypothetical protein VHG69_13585 [Thermoleophilaceae bacterium]|nr:hypothetical protein [Thermoleophilaceae bacterium]